MTASLLTTMLNRVYVQCDNSVVESVCLYDETLPPSTAGHASGPRSVTSIMPAPATGSSHDLTERRRRASASNGATAIERNEGVMQETRSGRTVCSDLGHRTVRQHVRALDPAIAGVGTTKHHCRSEAMKKSSAPTPDFLEIRLSWCTPDVDQDVAKR